MRGMSRSNFHLLRKNKRKSFSNRLLEILLLIQKIILEIKAQIYMNLNRIEVHQTILLNMIPMTRILIMHLLIAKINQISVKNYKNGTIIMMRLEINLMHF
ncbi:hypothetical protein M5D96_011749 [Drosophila gunungcola]|uniref:Uncharacterized protein n=1 Tax=Drosophila gunungcola TaxID=103775 RepID=A0A9Q0BK48_9MUSC|nr:hypothetical protein M5D96_011749 [Drosophila gunungcola]